MAQQFSWSRASFEEQQSCIGEVRHTACCGQTAWDVKGDLLLDWESRVYPKVGQLVAKNYSRIFKKGGVHAPITFQLYLLGTNLDPTLTQPTIVIWTSDKKAALRAKKVLAAHELFKSLDTGFNIIYEEMSIKFRAGDKGKSTAFDENTPNASSLTVLTALDTNESDQSWQRATLTCIVSVSGRYFSVLPAHTFYGIHFNIGTDSSPSHEDDSSPDFSSGESSSDDVSGSSTDSRVQDNVLNCGGPPLIQIPQHVVYFAVGNDNSDNRASAATSTSETCTQHKVLMGYLNGTSQSSPSLPRSSLYLDFDLALIEIKNDTLSSGSGLRWVTEYTIEVAQEDIASEIPEGSVIVACGVSGPCYATTLSSSALTFLPLSNRPTKVWQLAFTLNPGDSGSSVFDLQGRFIGMAICSVPERNITYVIPTTSILGTLAQSFEVSVPEMQLYHINTRALTQEWESETQVPAVEKLSQSTLSSVAAIEASANSKNLTKSVRPGSGFLTPSFVPLPPRGHKAEFTQPRDQVRSRSLDRAPPILALDRDGLGSPADVDMRDSHFYRRKLGRSQIDRSLGERTRARSQKQSSEIEPQRWSNETREWVDEANKNTTSTSARSREDIRTSGRYKTMETVAQHNFDVAQAATGQMSAIEEQIQSLQRQLDAMSLKQRESLAIQDELRQKLDLTHYKVQDIRSNMLESYTGESDGPSRKMKTHVIREHQYVKAAAAEEEQRYRETLRLEMGMLGKSHPVTLNSMSNLADALTRQRKYVEAEEMYREALQSFQTVLGKSHLDTLVNMNSLASVLIKQGKYVEAEEVHREVLTITETKLGKSHPDTLISMNNLASVLSKQGKYLRAEEVYREALNLRETTLGKSHPDMLVNMNNLASVLSKQDKYVEAEKVHREVLTITETKLGKSHPDTLISMNNLASVLSKQGKYIEAEDMHHKALQSKVTVVDDSRRRRRGRGQIISNQNPEPRVIDKLDQASQVIARDDRLR